MPVYLTIDPDYDWDFDYLDSQVSQIESEDSWADIEVNFTEVFELDMLESEGY